MIEINLDDPDFHAGDPDPAFAWLRQHDPVHFYEAGNFWAVSRHADVTAVSRDPTRFRSGGGVLMHDRSRTVSGAESVLYLDPPDHARYRRLVSRAFTPRRVAELEPRIRELCAEVLDCLEAGAGFDFVDAVAAPLPLLVMAELLGVPSGDRDVFRHWSDVIAAAAMGVTEEHLGPVMELVEYFQAALASRRREPASDLLSGLVVAEVDGEKLSEDEQLGFCMTLLVAGNETTRSLISGGALALAQHPDQQRVLAGEPARLPGAVEEMLRWVTPITTFARTAVGDVTLGGQRISDGDYVVMLYRSANRDTDVFGPTADRFDASRSGPGGHVSFGFGEHFCLGSGLARLEARVLFEELFARWPGLESAGPAQPIPSTLFNQLGTLPVRLLRH